MIGTVVGQGVIYIVQQSVVINVGVAVADTGGNVAIGNASTNSAAVSGQLASLGTSVVSGTATNTSNGVAIITTGRATAVGSTAVTTVIQMVSLQSTTATPVPYLLVQRSVVHNITIDLADTGGNVAIGNSSHNDAELGLPEGALAALAAINGSSPAAGPTSVAVAANVSGGTATIVTGAAVAGVVVTPPPEEPPPTPPVEAPAPPVAPAPVDQGAAPAVTPSGALPYTGGELGAEALAGVLLVAAGAAGVAVERRSRLSRRLRRR
jgi:hypothetical protein